ncbi:FtsX-like permease family protein [Pseudactinotalea sp.]|uniref:FtsX-like permease family protein n=1 Tax=Pseudactinotalea sp. TaxID=1926260 RepID=UPI003B3B8569
MVTALRMWLLLRKRDAGRTDPQRLTGVLAVLSFAVTTAVSLLVIGGFQAFAERAAVAPPDDYNAELYVLLAGTAAGLLLIPLVTLGGAASRLAVARRDERLAALRLAGAGTSQVSTLALLDSTVQAAVGAVIGAAAYFGLIPLVLPVTFQQQPFSYAELVLPWWVLPLAVLGVVLVALISAAASLRRVAITPLGVAARQAPPGLHWTRVVPIVVVGGVFAVLMQTGQASLIVLILFLLGGLAVVNLVGPWLMGVIGKVAVKRAKDAPQLIAARRLVDAPKTAWRSVGGVALATFVASMAAAAAMFAASDPDPVLADIGTGGQLTLVIAAVVAATSTGVMQAGRIIDQRAEYRALHLAGTDIRVMDKARLREVGVPLIAAVLLATAASSIFLLPALGVGVFTNPVAVGQYLVSVVGACALVLAGSWASKGVVRTVLS